MSIQINSMRNELEELTKISSLCQAINAWWRRRSVWLRLADWQLPHGCVTVCLPLNPNSFFNLHSFRNSLRTAGHPAKIYGPTDLPDECGRKHAQKQPQLRTTLNRSQNLTEHRRRLPKLKIGIGKQSPSSSRRLWLWLPRRCLKVEKIAQRTRLGIFRSTRE